MKNKNQPIYEITFWNIGPLDLDSRRLGPEPKAEKLLQLSKKRERGEIQTSCYWKDVGQSDEEWVANFEIQVKKLGPSPRTQFEDVFYLINEYFNKLGLRAEGENTNTVEVNYRPFEKVEFVSPIKTKSVYGKFPFPLPEKELKPALYSLFDEFKLSVSSYEQRLANYLNSERRELTRVRGIEKLCR